jgi:hypothetical protein
VQAAAFLARLFSTQNIKCALIVAPKTFITHWMRELKVVGLSHKTKEYVSLLGGFFSASINYLIGLISDSRNRNTNYGFCLLIMFPHLLFLVDVNATYAVIWILL